MCKVDPLYCQHYNYLESHGLDVHADCEGKCEMKECLELLRLKQIREEKGDVW